MEIVIGVSASVALYKTPEVIRALVKEGAAVTVLMTRNATQLVRPQLFAALTGRRVVADLFDYAGDDPLAHLSTTRDAGCFAVVPATANILGKLAAGIADDAVTTAAVSVSCPRLLAPAMNPTMWRQEVVQRNVAQLIASGFFVVPPEEGTAVCGDRGVGRLADITVITEEILRLAYQAPPFKGRRVVVTAGPTREFLDPVRCLSNPATGKMGYEIAKRAARRGAVVKLITGGTYVPKFSSAVEVTRVNTSAEMATATKNAVTGADALIMAAAVSDFKPLNCSKSKLKKTELNTAISLESTEDILKAVNAKKNRLIVIGFAAETDNLVENAKDKLIAKNMDFIVANYVGREGTGFGADNAEAVIVDRETVTELGVLPKAIVAEKILDKLGDIWMRQV